MYKVVPESNKEISKAHEEKWGSFNEFPIGWVDVSDQPDEVDKVMQEVINGNFLRIEGRQMYNRAEDGSWGDMTSATLFFCYGDDNFAIGKTYERGNGWIIKYYLFGCQHERQTNSKIGNCFCKYTCLDCGVSWNVDSGD